MLVMALNWEKRWRARSLRSSRWRRMCSASSNVARSSRPAVRWIFCIPTRQWVCQWPIGLSVFSAYLAMKLLNNAPRCVHLIDHLLLFFVDFFSRSLEGIKSLKYCKL